MKNFIALCMVLCAATPALASGKIPGFLTDYDKALTQAKKQDKLIFVHVTTDWCHWCRVLEKNVYKSQAGQKILKDYVCVSLNCTEPKSDKPNPNYRKNISIFRKLRGRGFPTLAVLASDGTPLYVFSGNRTVEKFKAELAKAEKPLAEYKKLLADFDAKKNDIDYRIKSMKFYIKAGDYSKAALAAKALIKLDPEFKKTKKAELYYIIYQAGKQAKAKNLADLKQQALNADVPEGKYQVKILTEDIQRDIIGGKYFLRKGNKEFSKKILNRALGNIQAVLKFKKFKNDPRMNMNLALTYFYLGEYQKTLDQTKVIESLDIDKRQKKLLKFLISDSKKKLGKE